MKYVLTIVFIIIFGIASQSINSLPAIKTFPNVTVAINSVYVYRSIKKVDIILTIFGQSVGDINVNSVYVQYTENGRKHKLDIPQISIPYKWSYAPEEYHIILNNNSWDWNRPNKISFITLELERNGIVFNVVNQSNQW